MNFISRIESFFSQRFGSRPALYVPTGRFGLWLALRHSLPASARVLVSPVTCEQVVLALLAAGMKPVLGPVNPASGNLDARALTDDHWQGIDAVLTTNLYGLPDDMHALCAETESRRIVLIEDACHAFDTSVEGQRIGDFGACAVFSLAKHLGGSGGVLLFRQERDREALQRMMREGLGSRFIDRLRALGGKVLPRSCPAAAAGHRTAYDRAALERAIRCAPDIKAFDAFLGEGRSSYRCMPTTHDQASTLAALEGWETEGARRRECVRAFLESGSLPAGVTLPAHSTPLRIPFFVERREGAIAKLAANGIRVSLVYDPPLHEHFPSLPSQSVRWTADCARWCDSVLPIAPGDLAKFAQLRDGLI